MNRFLGIVILAAVASGQAVNPDTSLQRAMAALRAFVSPENNVPHDWTGKAECIVVVPRVMKGEFLLGGKYGRGFASCRKATGGWTSPAAIVLEAGNARLQVAPSTDLIMLIMKPAGMKRLLGDKFTLGEEMAVAAGPVGANASANSDALAKAEMISWSQSKGVFTGVALEEATLRPDAGENKKLYGHEESNREILSGKVAPPRGARGFVALLNRRARRGK